jgi:hypothetical protein
LWKEFFPHHHRACELFLTFDRHVLTAMRNFVAGSVHCRRNACYCYLRQCHWLTLCDTCSLETAISTGHNHVGFEGLVGALMKGCPAVYW